MTGSRRSEALNAKWEHINYNSTTWLVPLAKSGQPRHVYLSDAAITVLERLRAEVFTDHKNPYIFPNPITGRPYKAFMLHGSWYVQLLACLIYDCMTYDINMPLLS
jgi:integrase